MLYFYTSRDYLKPFIWSSYLDLKGFVLHLIWSFILETTWLKQNKSLQKFAEKTKEL